MSESIRPALTPEEWAARRWVRRGGQPMVVAVTGGANVETLDIGGLDGPDWQLSGRDRKAVAALALVGHFTRDDLAMLYGLASGWDREDPERLESLAARIAELLPPQRGAS